MDADCAGSAADDSRLPPLTTERFMSFSSPTRFWWSCLSASTHLSLSAKSLAWMFLTTASLVRSSSGACWPYGCSLVPCSRSIHSKKSPVVCLCSLLKNTSSFHVPRDFSAHACVVMNGHLWKPFCESASSGRLLNNSDLIDQSQSFNIITLLNKRVKHLMKCVSNNNLVPSGDVRNMTTSPRRDALRLMNACTCSR